MVSRVSSEFSLILRCSSIRIRVSFINCSKWVWTFVFLFIKPMMILVHPQSNLEATTRMDSRIPTRWKYSKLRALKDGMSLVLKLLLPESHFSQTKIGGCKLIHKNNTHTYLKTIFKHSYKQPWASSQPWNVTQVHLHQLKTMHVIGKQSATQLRTKGSRCRWPYWIQMESRILWLPPKRICMSTGRGSGKPTNAILVSFLIKAQICAINGMLVRI